MKRPVRIARIPSNLWVFDLHPPVESIAREVAEGLSRRQKQLPPKLFYDRRGADLFIRICNTQAYYLTRTENRILDRHAEDMARTVGRGSAIIEYGAGAMEKIRRLLPGIQPTVYAALDISRSQVLAAGSELALQNPWLPVYAVVGDYHTALESELSLPPDSKRIVFFPGSTIGNFEPCEALAFLTRARELAGDAGGVLIGVDLCRNAARLNLAYNDPEGFTAAFNLNLLTRLNRELGANFDLAAFAHEAYFNGSANRIEMHLRSLRQQHVRIGDDEFLFRPGETIHTENSYKYSPESFVALARDAGFRHNRMWTDPAQMFGVFFLHDRPRIAD